MKPRLTAEQQNAVDQNQGCLEVEGGHGKYIIMSIDLYREMMGVGTDEEMTESLKAIEEGLADIDAGRTRPFHDVLDELGKNA